MGNRPLHRFWFTFQSPPQFSPLGLGCGITAQNYEDANKILASTGFAGAAVLIIESVVEDVDVQTLDEPCAPATSSTSASKRRLLPRRHTE